jgi:hypothetical protein
MITGTATRLAGKALGDFLKLATTATSAAVEKKVLDRLAGKAAESVDAPGLFGAVARHPETVAKLAGAAAPIAAAGSIAAGAGLINKAFQGQENVYAQSQYSLPLRQPPTPVAFSNQQYTPGMSPMTNQTVAEAMLEQQKFQHQLQLINARQSAQQGVGISGRTTGGGLDIMGLSQQVFAPVSY